MDRLKSQFMSNLLRIMLWTLLGMGMLELLGMIAAAIDVDFFVDYLSTPYSIIEIMGVALYYISVILYAIWIYRVHMDLNRLFPQFPRTPGGALAAIVIPLYNLYGIPAVYRDIGSHFSQGMQSLHKQGGWISRLAVPLLLLIMVMNGFSRYIQSAEEVGVGLLLTSSVISCMSYAVFLALVWLISSCMDKMFTAKTNQGTDERYEGEATPIPLNVNV
jgi:hypothetical protein